MRGSAPSTRVPIGATTRRRSAAAVLKLAVGPVDVLDAGEAAPLGGVAQMSGLGKVGRQARQARAAGRDQLARSGEHRRLLQAGLVHHAV